MKWTLRVLTLAGATVCGISFVGHIALLLRFYNYTRHRFYPFIVEDGYVTDTILLGLGLLCSGSLYLYLVRDMRSVSK
jgi:hypothetical protein